MPRLVDLIAAAVLAAGCGGAGRAPERHAIRVGPASALVEVAATPEARAKGLSGRGELAEGEGMLFLFGEAGRPSFWMKDTFVPLSIAFITPDGRIAEIQHMEPLSLAAHAPGRPVLMALEMPAGWFERNGVKAGDGLVLPAGLDATRAR